MMFPLKEVGRDLTFSKCMEAKSMSLSSFLLQGRICNFFSNNQSNLQIFLGLATVAFRLNFDNYQKIIYVFHLEPISIDFYKISESTLGFRFNSTTWSFRGLIKENTVRIRKLNFHSHSIAYVEGGGCRARN
jgi:hypothetical protein